MRKKLVLVALTLATILYLSYFMYRGYCYSQLPTTFEDPELGTVFVDYLPFTLSTEGAKLRTGIWFIFLAWVATIVAYVWKERIRGCRHVLALLLVMSFPIALIPATHPTYAAEMSVSASAYSIRIDIMCAGDEEFMANPENVKRAEKAIQDANNNTVWWFWGHKLDADCFENKFNLHFQVRLWRTWDSDDHEHRSMYMMAEAIEETGWYHDGEWGFEYDGYTIDMFCAFTGQTMEDKYAATFPDANATIIKDSTEWTDEYGYQGAIMHEFSHQFYTPKCSDVSCVMGDPIFLQWCDKCTSWINDHKHKWPTDYRLTISVSGSGGTTVPEPGKHSCEEGTSVTVTANPSSGYGFYYWILDGTTVYDNPITVIMGSDHDLRAYFRPLVHDVAVTSVSASPTSVKVGEYVTMNVTVWNQGDYFENYVVTIYYDDKVILTTWGGLGRWCGVSWQEYWNTAGVATGTYTIKAVASTVPGETDTDDNSYTDGTVEVYRGHDVAIGNIDPWPIRLNIGYSVRISVYTWNKGDYNETFSVTAYYGSTAIGTPQTVTNLAPGSYKGLLFTWDTTGMSGSQAGKYTISAYAWPVPGETDTADNTGVDGVVTVKVPGDANFDRHVDMTDFYIWREYWGKSQWPPEVDPDFDNNGYVEMPDYYIWANNFGLW